MLNKIKRSSVKITARVCTYFLITILIFAWIITDIIPQLGKQFNRQALLKTNTQKINRRVKRWSVLLKLNAAVCLTAACIPWSPIRAQSQAAPKYLENDWTLNSNTSGAGIWQNGIGNGFKSGVQSVGFGLGAGYGLHIFGGRQSHNLALGSIYYGYMLGAIEGVGHWYQGNWELRGELFSGAQFDLTSAWLVGLAPHLRYNFATGTRWVPYVDLGAGVSATSIGPPDLSHYFEFNLQAATGVRWFIGDNVALGIEARYLHMSCAGINTPNQGLNNFNGMLSVSWFF